MCGYGCGGGWTAIEIFGKRVGKLLAQNPMFLIVNPIFMKPRKTNI